MKQNWFYHHSFLSLSLLDGHAHFNAGSTDCPSSNPFHVCAWLARKSSGGEGSRTAAREEAPIEVPAEEAQVKYNDRLAPLPTALRLGTPQLSTRAEAHARAPRGYKCGIEIMDTNNERDTPSPCSNLEQKSGGSRGEDGGPVCVCAGRTDLTAAGGRGRGRPGPPRGELGRRRKVNCYPRSDGREENEEPKSVARSDAPPRLAPVVSKLYGA